MTTQVERHDVTLSNNLTFGAPSPFLFCERLDRRAGPGVDEAVIVWDHGLYLERLRNSPGGLYTPLTGIQRAYVRVRIWDPAGVAVTDTWVGVIDVVDNERATEGTTQTGRQTLTALGLVWELDRSLVLTSEVMVRGQQKRINRGLAFNTQGEGEFLPYGNRTEAKQGNTFIFSEDPQSQIQWAASEAIEYLLEYHGPRDGFGDPVAQWEVAGQTDAVDWYSILVPTDRRSVKAIIDDLVDRRRIAGYSVSYQNLETTGRVGLKLHTETNVPIQLRRLQIPANPDQQTLIIDTTRDVIDGTLVENSVSQFDVARAQGANIGVVFSLPVRADGIDRGWEPAQENEYRAGFSGDPSYAGLEEYKKTAANTQARTAERLRDVFERFVLGAAFIDQVFDWSNELDPYWIAPDPKLLDQMQPTDTRIATRADQPAPQFPIPDPQIYSAGRAFLAPLPLRNEADSEYVAPYSVFRVEIPSPDNQPLAERVYILGNKAADNADNDSENKRRFSVLTKMLPDRPGVRLMVQGGQQQLIASADWAGAAETDPNQNPLEGQNNALDFNHAFVTVARQSDDRISFDARTSQPGTTHDRVIIIDVPDARLDITIAGTILGVAPDGTLEHDEFGSILRDDRERLEDIASAAIQWYGLLRRSISVTYRQLNRRTYDLGTLITDVGGGYNQFVRSVVTQISYDFTNGTTTLVTSYGELDPVT